MNKTPVQEHQQELGITRNLLEAVIGESSQTVGVRLWDKTSWPDDTPRPVWLVLNHPGSLRRMFIPGTELGLAEAYLYDDFDIEGEIERVFDLAQALTERSIGWKTKALLARQLLKLPSGNGHTYGKRPPAKLNGQRHTIERDRKAVQYHYDISNDFYKLYLDQRMVYSCAYFEHEDDTLDRAQEQKLDLICRKLRLQPGQRLLDLGCGWGGLVILAAERYGVDATGITLSEPQAELANRRIREAGLQDRCRVQTLDYREIDAEGYFDALSSVGMFEHVGSGLLPTYFEQARRLLKPGGVFLNHGIARRASDKPPPEPSFDSTYVFPDGELLPINETLHWAEETGFEVRDVESLREHYAKTLRYWVRNLEAHHDEALHFVDEPTYRVWRLFMSGSAHGFTSGRLNLYQSLLVKPTNGPSGLPLTRKDWYLR